MFEAMAAERKRQRDEDREERRRVRVEDRDEREEREAETSRRMAASQESRAHALYVSESAEKVRSWELYLFLWSASHFVPFSFLWQHNTEAHSSSHRHHVILSSSNVPLDLLLAENGIGSENRIDPQARVAVGGEGWDGGLFFLVLPFFNTK